MASRKFNAVNQKPHPGSRIQYALRSATAPGTDGRRRTRVAVERDEWNGVNGLRHGLFLRSKTSDRTPVKQGAACATGQVLSGLSARLVVIKSG